MSSKRRLLFYRQHANSTYYYFDKELMVNSSIVRSECYAFDERLTLGFVTHSLNNKNYYYFELGKPKSFKRLF